MNAVNACVDYNLNIGYKETVNAEMACNSRRTWRVTLQRSCNSTPATVPRWLWALGSSLAFRLLCLIALLMCRAMNAVTVTATH